MFTQFPEEEVMRRIKSYHRANAFALVLNSLGLTKLPEAVCELPGLQALQLQRNQLTALPESIGDLIDLDLLDVSDNQLTALPKSLLRLKKLQTLNLSGNPLDIPPEILSLTPSEILRYYFKGPRRRLNEAKVLLVGQGGVGKTSLIKRLVSNEYDPAEPKTEGINITRWQVPGRMNSRNPVVSTCDFIQPYNEREPVRLNIWDFGGQEIMHATHQFFLTKRSLYLVVLDARKGEQDSNIHYWLKIIQSYGGGSPVLVVINKSEPPNSLALNETRLHLDFEPNLKGFVKVSCATGAGVEELRAMIEKQVNGLPHVVDELPVTYFEAKATLEEAAKKKQFIDYGEFQRLCRKTGVTEAEDQNILIRFLHDLGTVLYYHDPESPFTGLRDTNILDPEWVTGGVYKILNNLELMQDQGKLDRAHLAAILTNQDGYPPDRHDFIIGMMRKFELCFDFPDSAGRKLLVPELLSKNEPHLGWHISEALQFEYHYNVLPEGLIPRFIVKMHRNLTEKPTYWRSGVVLDIDGNIVLVRGDIQLSKIFIAVLGPVSSRREALAVVRNVLQDIHATIPKIHAAPRVALPGKPGIFLDYDALRAYEKKGYKKHPVYADGIATEVFIDEVLSGIDPSRVFRPTQVQPESNKGTQPQRETSPWTSGSFYLFALVIVMLAGAVAAFFVPWYAVIPAFLVALLGVTIVAILQLKNDKRMKDKDFIELLKEFFRSLALLKLGYKRKEHLADSDAPAPQTGDE